MKQISPFILLFLTVHGLVFLGVGYWISYFNPQFSLIHSGIGIFVYMVFFAVLFQKHFLSAVLGAMIALGLSYYWGDILIDHFYPASVERTTYHKMYAMMMVLYLYVYLDLAFLTIKAVVNHIKTKRSA